jgi:MinD-like ATPase involved in chromosome partitioning or flagellar assembly
MYAITFYSFKGGVGRTMALVNVAVQLAVAGKRVLIVDFDLEAPGIPTFSLTAPKSEVSGLVEYITEYRHTAESPDVRNFVYLAQKFDSGGELSVMPAGRHDGTYSQRLNAIDWHTLYSAEDGYLFFEDLKRQWAANIGIDYVLIDSRTGHSDVEGICTRQLPDAVCLLFFPNEQNLQGLKRVVGNVRAQNSNLKAPKEAIALHFVVSNVPDLDDEERIIGSTLDKFKSELKYEELSGQIHHYNSLSLLNQEIFSEKRPNSRLTKEYKRLTDEVIRDNLSDRDVAKKFLRKTVRELRSGNAGAMEKTSVNRAEKVLQYFSSDTEINLDVALIYEGIGRTKDALTLLLSSNDSKSTNYFATRARLNHRLGSKAEAVSDLQLMLDCDDSQVPSLLEGLAVASELAPALFQNLANRPAMKSLSQDDRRFVALQIEGGTNELEAQAEILEALLPDSTERDLDVNVIALASIGLGRFDRAIELLAPVYDARPDASISVAFNLAMARWGAEGLPRMDLFSRVVELDAGDGESDTSPNYLACLGIAHAVIGQKGTAVTLFLGATKQMKSRPRREFSPWTYTKVPAKEFLRHLAEMEQQVMNGAIKPEFLKMAMGDDA